MYISSPSRINKTNDDLMTFYTKELFKLEVLKTATGCQELSQTKLLPLEPKSGTLQALLQQVLQALEDRDGLGGVFY